jgi:peptidyl-prolyl cis-trans isomerase D
MLKAIRDNLKYLSWVLWIVIATFIAAIFFDFGGLTGGFGAPTEAAATVAGEPITFRDYEDRFRALEQQYRQMFGAQYTPEMAKQFGLERQALESLINSRVLLLEAKRLGLAVGDEELREAILEIPGLTEEGAFVGEARYEELLQANGYTVERFEGSLREDLLLQKMRQIMVHNVFVSDAEVEQAFREESERAEIRYLILPQSRFGAEATATAQELEEHLATHPEEFRVPEQRRIAYLLVDRARVAQEVTPDETALSAYYDEHPEEFTTDEQVQARHILLRTGDERGADEARAELAAARARIEAGEGFAAVAQEVSEDPGSGARGGDLGFFGRGQMVPEFEEAAFGAAVGELVGPVESPFGVHLLEVTARREAGQRPFAEVRGEIAQQLGGELAGERAREIAREVTAELRTGEASVEALQRVADARPAVELQQPEPIARQGFVPGLGRVPELNEAAFALQAGAVAEPVEVPRGFAVATVLETLPSRVPPLADVEPQVRNAVEQEKRRQLAMARLAEAKGRLAGGATLADVAAELGVEVQESGEFAADGVLPGLGSAPEVTRAALAASEGDVVGPLPSPQGAVLFEVTARTRFDPAELAARRGEVRERLLQERVALLQQALLQQRREELEVTIDRRVAEEMQAAGAES